MILAEVADVIVGQIMTRVTTDDVGGIEVKVLVPKAISEGIVIKEELGSSILTKEIDKEKYTKAGDVIIKLSTPYDAAYITDQDEGLVLPSFCAAVRCFPDSKIDEKYLTAYLNSQYVKEQLLMKVKGSNRPMIKVSDIRMLVIPEISDIDMKELGEAYMLSGRKKALLFEMIETEREIMENIILKSIVGGVGHEK